MEQKEIFRGIIRKEFGKDKLYAILAALENLADEPVMEIGQEGVRLVTLDPARITLIDAHINKDAIDAYYFNGDKDVKIGIPVREILDIVKKMNKTNELYIKVYGIRDDNSLDNYEEYSLVLTVAGKSTKTYRFNNLNDGKVYSNYPEKIPNIANERTIRIGAKDFYGSLVDIYRVSDNFKISLVKKDNTEALVVIKSSGNEVEDLRHITIEIPGELEMNATDSDEVGAMYPISEALASKSLAKIFDDIHISLRTDNPISLEFENENIKILHMVAPKLKE